MFRHMTLILLFVLLGVLFSLLSASASRRTVAQDNNQPTTAGLEAIDTAAAMTVNAILGQRPTSTLLATATLTPSATKSAIVPYLGVLLRADFSNSPSEAYSKYGNDNWEIVQDGKTQVACNEATTEYSGIGSGSNTLKDYSVEFLGKVTAWDRKSDPGAGVLNLQLRTKVQGGNYIASTQYQLSVPDGGISLNYDNVNDNPRGRVLAGAGINARKNTWFIFRGEVQGDRWRGYFNGRLVIDHRDDKLTDGSWGIIQFPATTLCLGYFVVRSLDTSPEALAIATQDRLNRAVPALLSPDKSASVVTYFQKGERVFVLDVSTDGTLTLARIDRTGIQGWIPSDALEPVATSAGSVRVRVVSQGSVNLRSCAGTDCAAVDRAANGDELIVIEDLGSWLHIQTLNGTDAYISAALVQPE